MKQNNTILFLSRLYHPHIGGVEKHVEKVSSILVKKGFTVIVLTELYDNSLRKEEVLNGVVIKRVPVGKSLFLKKFLIWKWVILHPGIFLKADLIHIHDVFYWIIPLIPFLCFKKIFITFHGYEGYPVKMKWIVQRKIAETFCRGSVCVGDFMKKWYVADPNYVIYGGVDKKKGTKIPKSSKSAVFFGRFDPQTGIDEYLKAFLLIRKEIPSFSLTLVGGGEAGMKIPKGVRHYPFTKDVAPYIENNRFIFVSRYLSMLEALVQKREVVAVYSDPVKRDYLVNSPFNDFVFAADNAKGIANHILKSLKTKTVSSKTAEGYKWAKNQTWERIVDVYLKLWNLA